jgi:hypothetical protein
VRTTIPCCAKLIVYFSPLFRLSPLSPTYISTMSLPSADELEQLQEIGMDSRNNLIPSRSPRKQEED